MKTNPCITLGLMIGASMIASAQDNPKEPPQPKGPPAEVVKRFDKDGDGKLSDEERKPIEEARQAVLKKFDKDGDGKLSVEERKTMEETQLAARQTKIEEAEKQNLAKFDKDGDGKLNDEEKINARAAHQAELIKKFDTDGDGMLSEEERERMPKPPAKNPGAAQKAPKAK